MRAARYLGVSPWELEKAPMKWRQRALMAESAERWAEAERAKMGW